MNIEGTGKQDPLIPEAVEAGKHYDLSELKRLAAGDDKFFRDMIRTFIDSTSEGVAAICKYANERNWEQTAHYSHKIAAPCRHLGALELYSLLQKIEDLSRKGERGVEEIPHLAQKLDAEAGLLFEQLKLELDRIKV
jgi:HPt (histidine-containing phosphotransfer) domain-containing protein